MTLPIVEPVKRAAELSGENIAKDEVIRALDRCCAQIDLNMEYFSERFPKAVTKGGVYPVHESKDWTEGFWTGLLWMAYEYSGEERYRALAEKNVADFSRRLDENVVLDHHDLGFLYTPSCVSAYRITGSELARETALRAVDRLMRRWQPKGKFIQAWGPMDSPEHYRFIVDCLMNIPLLHWAARETGEDRYEQVAREHFATTVAHVIRPDGSTFHTFYMDPVTGKPVRGATRQGYSDDSSWARGQAWAIYGLPLNARLTGDASCEPVAEAVANYFLNRLPDDLVCYWDLIFGEGDGMPRDSSAAAIAACGFDELCGMDGVGESERAVYRGAGEAILRMLASSYMPLELKAGAPLLEHAVYNWHTDEEFDCGCCWGDFFYMEALMRARGGWKPYW